MRVVHPPLQALLEGNALDQVALIEIQLAKSSLRYAVDDHPRIWDGKTFLPTGGGFSEVEENAERGIPSLNLSLQNRDGVLGPLLFPGAGGEDVRGKRASIYVARRDFLTGAAAGELVIGWTLFVNNVRFLGREAVVLELGVFPAEVIRVPNRNLQGLRCTWVDYKGVHCGYAGDLPTCDRTLDDCRKHFDGEPLRFGGFPAQTDARALRL